mgnify:FL=1
MKNLKKTIISLLLFTTAYFTHAQEKQLTKESFDVVNLHYPGLENVNQLFTSGKYD